METERRTLAMRYTFKELANLLNVTPKTLRKEINENKELSQKLTEMGLTKFKRPLKKHVIVIFQSFGFPDGYEHYERNEKN